MTTELRPLALGELFDRGFTMYRRNLWLFVGIIAFPSVAALLMGIFAQVFQRSMLTAGQTEDPSATAILTVAGLLIGVFLLMIVYWIVYMIALGATTFAVGEIYVGRPTSVREAYAGIKGRIGRLLILMLLIGIRFVVLFVVGGIILTLLAVASAFIHPILSGVTMVGGMLLLIVASFFLMLRYAMSVPAIVLETLTPGEAIKRSVDLARGRLGRLFLLGLCSMVITYAAMAMLQGPFTVGAFLVGPETMTAFWLNIAGTVTGTVASAFTTPFLVIGIALIYYDARIREEAFDVELALQVLEARDKHPAPTEPS